MSPTIYTGKKKLIETEKKQQPKQLPPIVEPALTPIPREESGAGGGMAAEQMKSFYPEYQTIEKGKLKPEFQKMENVAASIETGGLTPEQQLLMEQATRKTDWETFVGREGVPSTNVIAYTFQTAKAVINEIGRKIPIIGSILASKIPVDDYKTTITNIKDAVEKGSMTPAQAEVTFTMAQNDLIQLAGAIQQEAKFDTAALIDGRLSDNQKKLLEAQIELRTARMDIANIIRARMAANIAARPHLPQAGAR